MHRERVLLVGQGPTTMSAVAGLIDQFDLVAVVRDGDDQTTSHARDLGVRLVSDVSKSSVRTTVETLRPDCVVVSSYDRILDADLVSSVPFVNVHYAPLPRMRGRATVNWAIINGETTASITIHRLVAGLDSGGILFQDTVTIDEQSTVASVYEELNERQRANIARAVRSAIAGAPGVPQEEHAATYACSRVVEDGEIDWNTSTTAIDRLIRALVAPYPGAFTWIGLTRLYIDVAMVPPDGPTFEGRVPGRVVNIDRTQGSVDVLTGDGVLRLAAVRFEGEPSVPAASVIRSVRATLGLRSVDLVAEIERLRDAMG